MERLKCHKYASKMSILNLNISQNVGLGLGETKYIKVGDMEQLSYILVKMENVYLNGQTQIRQTGWEKFIDIFQEMKTQKSIQLKLLDIKGCLLDQNTFKLLENTLQQLDHEVKVIHDQKI